MTWLFSFVKIIITTKKFNFDAKSFSTIKKGNKMVKVAVFFANGSEEIEALTPVDVIRRGGAKCDIVSVSGAYPIGSHCITVMADKLIEDINESDYDAFVIPGGMPGATNFAKEDKLVQIIKTALAKNKTVASICASPAVVLANNALIDGRKATCYPAQVFIQMMERANFLEQSVVIDGNLITANGPKSAMQFSLEICNKLGLEPKF